MSCIEDIDCPHCIIVLEKEFNWTRGYKVFRAELERSLKTHKEELAKLNECSHIWDKEFEDWGYGTYKQCSQCWTTIREVTIFKNQIETEENLLGKFKHG